MSVCMICPRRCGIDRQTARGFCGVGEEMRIVRVMRHSFEEPCIAGEHGAGAIFFTGCNLGCVFCQNAPISHPAAGHEPGDTVSPRRLADIMLELQAAGLSSVDLVTPTHFTPRIAEALRLARMDGLSLPVVWNSGGYERVETLRTLEGKVQIYLPDLKYAMERPARELSAAPDYFEVAAAAIDEMVRQVGAYKIGDDGLMRSGVILRHLVLPGQMENTKRVIDYVSTHFPPKTVLFSLMSQYTPQPGSTGALARRLNEREYRTAVQYMRDCSLTDGFCQELSSAKAEYTPVFDLQGV